MFAKSLVYPNRQPVLKNPADYGMKYQDIEFKTPDNILLKGWFIPGEKESVGIITHPMNFTKYGYSVEHQGTFKITDIEVEFLKTAKTLNDHGHNVLMFDLRNHGDSESSEDGLFGLGLYEWQDVVGALNYITARQDLKNRKIFFVSFCTGANSTIIAMSKAKDKFDNVKCVVAVQPISMDVFVNSFMEEEYSLFTGMIPGIEEEAIDMGGFPFEEMGPLKYVKGITAPVFYIQAENDKWTDVEYVKEMYEESPDPKELLLLEGDMHRFDTYNYFGDHPEQLLTFIDKYL
jgi:pimeloyl-ACP methyl ester carboxylesterase